MERLTKRNSNGSVSVTEKFDELDALKRLAAYEDMGLEPEEVNILNDTIAENVTGMRGVKADRLAVLVEADKEGRLLVLPCKVGDTIYVIRDRKIYESKVYHISYSDYRGKITATAWTETGIGAAFEHFGKTVSLTREKAEKALKGVSEDA